MASEPPARFTKKTFAILLTALIFRAGFLWTHWNNLEMDASFLFHAEVARNVLAGHWLQMNHAYLDQYIRDCRDQGKLIDPQDYPLPKDEVLVPIHNDEGGYGILLAIFWKVFGERRWWYVRVLQIILDTMMCWLIYQTVNRKFKERPALIAAFLYACFIPAVDMAVRPHRDIWVNFLYISTVYFLTRTEKGSLIQFALIGAITGIVAWMRSTVVLYVFALSGILFVASGTNRQTLYRVSALCAAFAMMLTPLLIRNYSVLQKLTPTRGAFWHAFWGGVGQMPNNYGLKEDDEAIAQFARKLNPNVKFDTIEYEETLKQEALVYLREHPWHYAASVAKRSLAMVFPKLGRELFFQPQERESGTLNKNVNKGFLILVDSGLVCLFLFGVWSERARWKDVLVIALPYLYTIVTLSPLVFQGRNLYNTYFVVLIFASVGVVNIWEKRSRPRANFTESESA